MISEISSYVEYFQKQSSKIKNILSGNPDKGIHIWIQFKEIIPIDDKKIFDHLINWIEKFEWRIYQDEEDKEDKFFKKILEYENLSSYIDNNKRIKSKKIFTNNPFLLSFKILEDKKREIKDLKNFVNLLKEKLKKIDINSYYETLKKQYSKNIPEEVYDFLNQFINKHLINIDFWNQFLQEEDFIDSLYSKDEKGNQKFKLDKYSRIWFLLELPTFIVNKKTYKFQTILKQSVDNYFSQKIFNKDDYNFDLKNEIYGLSNFFNGDNIKKPFLKHLSTPFIINNRISLKEAHLLFQFEKFLRKRVLPNPLPIFVDEQELNEKVVSIYKEEGEKIKFKDLIRKLYEHHKKDLGNYYLLYIKIGQKIEIKDIDYVSNFKYKLEDYKIERFNGIFDSKKNETREAKIDDIFLLEFYILRMFFSEQYLENKETIDYYFDYESKDPALNAAFASYKPYLYNFIYKSRQEWMKPYIWKNICESALMYHMRKRDFTDTYTIREILRTYFSLNHHFDENNTNFGGKSMPTELPKLNEKIKNIVSSENEHFESDEEFAFGAGQMIYFLLYQSETANKTHQLLEPFLNKQRIQEFKKSLERTFEYYKHNIGFHHKQFNRLAREVFGYVPESSIKNLKPYILAGYFANNILLQKIN